jgi:hypothetical protein
MRAPSQGIRRALWLSAAAATAVGMTVAGLTSAASAQPTSPSAVSLTATAGRGPGYPPPAGIYAPFVNCPLNNPLMHENGQISANGFGGFAACTAGDATGGSITIGNITTPVTEPVNVQFGFAWQPSSTGFPLPAYPPLAGESALLSTKPDLIPQSLTTALGCATATDPTVLSICKTAQARGGVYNQVFALAREAGALTNFNLFTWTQPVKFQLINPLLGSSCFIGTDSNPIVLNPQLSLGPGGTFTGAIDPAPTVHPDTEVIALNGAVASDSTFSAPGVVGCGPGGAANDAVDTALNTGAGLPAASGTNSLTLTGTFSLAINFASEDSSLTQPQDDAGDLLAAFKASTNGEHSVKHLITKSQVKSLFHKG